MKLDEEKMKEKKTDYYWKLESNVTLILIDTSLVFLETLYPQGVQCDNIRKQRA